MSSHHAHDPFASMDNTHAGIPKTNTFDAERHMSNNMFPTQQTMDSRQSNLPGGYGVGQQARTRPRVNSSLGVRSNSALGNPSSMANQTFDHRDQKRNQKLQHN